MSLNEEEVEIHKKQLAMKLMEVQPNQEDVTSEIKKEDKKAWKTFAIILIGKRLVFRRIA